MSGIIVPCDRTTKQPGRGYCFNPDCRESSLDDRFEFNIEDDLLACPKCGATDPPMVGLLVLTHFLVTDPKGPVVGARRQRYRLACDSHRAYLATRTNMEAASGELSAVNCPGCLAAAMEQKLPARSGLEPVKG